MQGLFHTQCLPLLRLGLHTYSRMSWNSGFSFLHLLSIAMMWVCYQTHLYFIFLYFVLVYNVAME